MEDYQFSVLSKLYLFGKRLQALAKKHNSDVLSRHIILHLASARPVSVSDIAAMLSIKVSAATAKILEMESQGLLERIQSDDRRSHIVGISPKGRKALRTAAGPMGSKKHRWFCLSRTECHLLESLLSKIRLKGTP